MLDKLTDKSLTLILKRGKRMKGLAPFLRPTRGMIAFREEGYRRGIMASPTAMAVLRADANRALAILAGE